MRPCPICKAGNLQPGHTTVMLERGGAIVLLKFVPAMLCDQCDSYFLDKPTTKTVLEAAERSVQNGAELEVIRLRPEAA